MIVSNKVAVQRIAHQEQKQGGRIKKQGGSQSFNDEVRLSSEGKEMQAMLQKLQAAPAIRPQAEEIKVAVQEGTYKVSPRQVAAGILQSWDRS